MDDGLGGTDEVAVVGKTAPRSRRVAGRRSCYFRCQAMEKFSALNPADASPVFA